MEKHKRWQFYLIITVIALTLYNIFPTVFYYSKPLKKPVGKEQALVVAHDIAHRVDALGKDSVAWLKSYCSHIGVKPLSVTFDPSRPDTIELTFANEIDAEKLRIHLSRAGAMIPFTPSQLQPLAPATDTSSVATNVNRTVVVKRAIGTYFATTDINRYFTFSEKADNDIITPLYRELAYDRAAHVGAYLGGTSSNALYATDIINAPSASDVVDDVIAISTTVVDISHTFGEKSSMAKRFFSSFSQSTPAVDIRHLIARIGEVKDLLAGRINAAEKDAFLSGIDETSLRTLKNHHVTVSAAEELMKKYERLFKAGTPPISSEDVMTSLADADKGRASKVAQYQFSLGNSNPYFSTITIDWNNDAILLYPHSDLATLIAREEHTEEALLLKEKTNKLLFDEVAALTRATDETVSPHNGSFSISLNALTGSKSFLALDLTSIARDKAIQLRDLLRASWNPQNSDLKRDAFPIIDYKSYQTLSPEERQLGLVVVAPVSEGDGINECFKDSALYVIARGLDAIVEKYRAFPNSEEMRDLANDISSLQDILHSVGFIVDFPGESFASSTREFVRDHIFESGDYYSNLLKATREDFHVYGSRKYAVLEFSNLEQRLITSNTIDNEIHEDLLHWRDDYHAAQVSSSPTAKFEVPAPTKSIFFDNLALSAKKYFRGDDRKIIKWGLDLSGGKTVVIELRDQNNTVVENEADLELAVNELTARVNKMGVAEVNIRTEGSKVVMEFPGAQGLSASDLIKSSAMYFHIVNERFSPQNPALAHATEQFLQGVWNEAVITEKTDIESINAIAWRQLGGDLASSDDNLQQLSESAHTLYDNGLRLVSPHNTTRTNAFDDTTSMIAIYRGDTYKEWHGQTNPLLIVFNNYALEGSLLEDVHTGYDPSEGNMLSFGVQSSYTSTDGVKSNPRDDFYTWTSQFSQDRIASTPKEAATQGRGWRMAVILNGQVVSDPSLKAALRNGGTITGSFSQREISRLASDLKAGSLSFTPKILKEENISAELGKQERMKGIFAASIGLVAVIAAMVTVYSFSGIVASCAVLFNLLIMWGVLQNIGAALTLPGIAGIILTIGMAVDANVLVYERIREEFALSKRLGPAIQKGYSKAFSAIVDSNITTIIAALVLIQFDSGPIKGFATTLIIGIASSMFTALFMTRYFFTEWVMRTKDTALKMRHLFAKTKIDFLKMSRSVIIVLVAIIAIGSALLITQRHALLGMDFTGGYALNIVMEENGSASYRTAVTNALLKQGLDEGEFQVRELNKPTHLRIQLGMNIERPGNAFAGMPIETTEDSFKYTYEKNPRILWIVDALKEAGLSLDADTLPGLDQQLTSMSGLLSGTMRNNALMGLGIALICMLIYITFRFEFKYAISATLCLVHDVLITLGTMAILNKLGLSIQIDLTIIGAIMTIVGYSLNDTIIIFDRIREDIRLFKKMSFPDLINYALNATLSRTIMTSLTTLLVLASLVIFGGSGIFDFALVMMMGVIFGTLSSLFIAAPLMLFFHNREVAHEESTGTH